MRRVGLFFSRGKALRASLGLLIVAVYLFPLYWIFANSIKPSRELFAWPPVFFPLTPDFGAYLEVIRNGILWDMANSLIIAVPTMVLTVVMGTLSAYAIARSSLKWINWLILVFLVSQLLPPVLMATPMFVLFYRVGLTNTYWGVILAITTLTMPFYVVIVRPAFLSIPQSVEESAQLDGCSAFGTLLWIAAPIIKPTIAVASAISFLWAFGNFVYPVSLLTSEQMFPTMVRINALVGAQTTRWDMIMAYSVITLIPTLIVFLFFHKHLVKGITAGSVK